MSFTLTPSYDDHPRLATLVPRLRDYLDGELAEYEQRLGLGPETRYTREQLEPVWRRSRELGFYGIHLPPALGGQGLSYTELAVLKEEVGASGRILAHSVLGDMGGPLRVGSIFGVATDHQLEKYLMPVLRGERACCSSLTEEDAGSDVRRMRTIATPDGDGWRLTGRKVFSSAGPFADFSVLVARMAPAGDTDPEVYSAFLVDLDSPGCTVVDGDLPMSGQHVESDIILDDCYVGPEQLLGSVGDGLRIGLGRVTVNRLLHCPTVLGSARRALHLTVDFAKTRHVQGAPLAALQSIQHKIADMATDYYAARSMTYDALAALDAGTPPRVEAFMCKLFVAEHAFRIADEAVQIHGKAGMVRGAEVEWLFRRLRMFRVLTGSSEIQKNGIAKQLLAQPARGKEAA
ncbi:acyl-CoA dehydrogenase [Rhodococcus aetherivorans]|uniref:Acyl-CoA dehydrogenase n=2 Tax=Rhodococcus TaxID=1827 RepID=A0ABQ0YJZ2_9NOCA|nr:acyl-CoA dehydrogenase family protein [Rhodococcus aetherivorans]ETT27187.1 Butyryl-CoA dehydrogenase [Rhodococcus rhodochrous ATCC 21198]NGP26967.1 acyl-CoA dehydrogenase family protein [Rhodococcus aetherivorans]GES36873.1 acyl-CoA dehydrogenase [Rhodococcus aetherivorans]